MQVTRMREILALEALRWRNFTSSNIIKLIDIERKKVKSITEQQLIDFKSDLTRVRNFISPMLTSLTVEKLKEIFVDKRIRHHKLFQKKVIDRIQKNLNLTNQELEACKLQLTKFHNDLKF